MRLRLFSKYALFISTLVVGLLAVSWALILSIAHEESIRHLRALQNEKAHLAAARIGQFLRDVEQQVSWIDLLHDQPEPSLWQLQRFELLKVLKKLPQVSEVTLVDAKGKEKLFLSRAALDRSQSGIDHSSLNGMSTLLAGKAYLGKPFFLRDSEPHLLFMYPMAGGGGVIADINLKLIWETVREVSERGRNTAYVVDSSGTLIAHPEIDYVLRKLSFTQLPQVSAAFRGTGLEQGLDLSGGEVLSAFARISNCDWLVFVETPMDEIRSELRGLLQKATVVLVIGLLLSVVSSYWLARRLISPIDVLRNGVAKIREGEVLTKIEVRSNDELEHRSSTLLSVFAL